MEILLSMIQSIFSRYRTRKFLRTKVKMYVNGSVVPPKKLLEYYDLAEKQAMLRQIFGVAGGGRCEVSFDKEGNAEVK